jgi:hypothetical protein
MEAKDSKIIIRILRVELEPHEILINSVRYLPKHLGGWGRGIKDKYNKCNVSGHRLICTYLIQGHAARVPSLTPDPTRRFALSLLSLSLSLSLLSPGGDGGSVVVYVCFASANSPSSSLACLPICSSSLPPVPQGIQKQLSSHAFFCSAPHGH